MFSDYTSASQSLKRQTAFVLVVLVVTVGFGIFAAIVAAADVLGQR